jgi:hypothetical protein
MVQNIKYLNGKGNQFVCAIIQKLQPQITCPGDFIVRQGDQSDGMFFLKKGSCIVLHDDAPSLDGKTEGGRGDGIDRSIAHSGSLGGAVRHERGSKEQEESGVSWSPIPDADAVGSGGRSDSESPPSDVIASRCALPHCNGISSMVRCNGITN